MISWKKNTAIELRHDSERQPVPIVADGALAIKGQADGRMVPVLILDTIERPDIRNMIGNHHHSGPGDVKSFWAQQSRLTERRLRLILSFTKPSECNILLEFDVNRQGGLVDLIIRSQGLILQAGQPGDRLASTLDNKRVLIEIPSPDFSERWNKILRKTKFRHFRKQGLSRREAKQQAEEYLKTWREGMAYRL